MLSGLVSFLEGSFNKIKKDDNGKIFIEFTLPFGALKTMNFTSINSPKTRGTSKRTVINGNIQMSSPISGFRNPALGSSSAFKSKMSRISSIRETIRNVESMSSEELKALTRDNRNATISVGNLNEVSEQSAAPSVRLQNLSTKNVQAQTSPAPQEPSSNTGARESSSLGPRKSNFASKKNKSLSHSEGSVSDSNSNTFDYSRQVLEDKTLLKKQDSSQCPNSALVYDRTDSIIHPRVKYIELQERLKGMNKRKDSTNMAQSKHLCLYYFCYRKLIS